MQLVYSSTTQRSRKPRGFPRTQHVVAQAWLDKPLDRLTPCNSSRTKQLDSTGRTNKVHPRNVGRGLSVPSQKDKGTRFLNLGWARARGGGDIKKTPDSQALLCANALQAQAMCVLKRERMRCRDLKTGKTRKGVYERETRWLGTNQTKSCLIVDT